MDEADVQQRARAFIAGLDIQGIRDDLSVYVKAAKAVLRKEKLGVGESGTTVTRPDGKHVITVSEGEPNVRQRFTICHEVAHIVLGLPSIHTEIPSWSYAKRDPNEIACDTFATELLMPYTQWLAQVPKDEPSHAMITQLAESFGCSYPAAASRYATLTRIPCAFVTMEKGFIRYAARSTPLRRAKAWIPPKVAIPKGSVAYNLREGGTSSVDSDTVAQDIWFSDWESGLDLSEICRHYQSSDTTLSLLWFEEEELPNQEADRFGRMVQEDPGLRELTGELPWPGRSRRKK